jgi:hypothetical protein
MADAFVFKRMGVGKLSLNKTKSPGYVICHKTQQNVNVICGQFFSSEIAGA